MNMTSEERSSNGSSNSNEEDKKQKKNKNKKTKNGAKMRIDGNNASKEKEEELNDDDDDDDNDEFEIEDDTIVFCQEMNDNHIEEHTFKELVAFCACGKNDPDAGGNWTSISDGNYLQNNDDDDYDDVEEEDDDDTDSNNNKKKKKKTISSSIKSSPSSSSSSSATAVQRRKQSKFLKGAFVVDQRLLPRISEGEIRMVFVKDELVEVIHKKPVGENGRSAVAWNNKTMFYRPDEPLFRDLTEKFLKNDIQRIAKKLNLAYNALPLLWTADFIPMNDDTDDDTSNTTQNDAKTPEREKKKKKTRYILGEFNCSCVGLTKFRAACGPDKDMSDVSDQDYFDGAELCDLIGKRCKMRLDEYKGLKRKKMVQRIVWGTFSLLASFAVVSSGGGLHARR